MNRSNRKEYLFIMIVLFAVIGLAFLLSNMHQRLVNQYPDQLTQLSADDFVLGNTPKPIYIGRSTGEEVKQAFPAGETLGMSSAYRPAGQKTVYTFTKKSDILTKVDITGPGQSTSRGIAVNDPFEKAIKAYGKDYVKSYIKNNPKIFDAIYGSEQYIIFHVKDGLVERIVLEYPLADKKK